VILVKMGMLAESMTGRGVSVTTRWTRPTELGQDEESAESKSAQFELLFRSHFGTLVQSLGFVAMDRQAAEDAVQDAFLRLYDHWDEVVNPEDSLPWLYRAAFNRIIDQRRAAGRVHRLFGVLVERFDLDRRYSSWEARPEFIGALRRLPLKQRTAASLLRQGQSMAFAPVTGSVVLFGGAGAAGPLQDTWAYDPLRNAWSECTTSGPSGMVAISPPSPRQEQSMVFDPLTGQVILFGGAGEDGPLGDTWSCEPISSTWIELHPLGPLPVPRGGQAMVFDITTGQVYLVGGAGAGGVLGDIWAYDAAGNTWASLSQYSFSWPFRSGQAMACSSATGRIVLFGGQRMDWKASADTWFSDAGRNWTGVPAGDGDPSARSGSSMVYCELTDSIVLFGGVDADGELLNDTWVYWQPNIRH
jgi:DNA-directed RNA polymerase specialized sigma24 family protein